jgi:phosphatidylglycerophosphatase A
MPIAPGTFGTLWGVLIYWFISGLAPVTLAATIVGFIFISVWLSDVAIEYYRDEDPRQVVIDEVAGYLVTMFLHGATALNLIAGFILFRIFDISKPFPIGLIEKRLKGGMGVVMDDVMAGIYANLALYAVNFLYLRFF